MTKLFRNRALDAYGNNQSPAVCDVEWISLIYFSYTRVALRTKLAFWPAHFYFVAHRCFDCAKCKSYRNVEAKVMTIKFASVAVGLISLFLATNAKAASCWDVTGWVWHPSGEQAVVVPADCTRVPAGEYWTDSVTTMPGYPAPNDSLFLQVWSGDSAHMVDNGVFSVMKGSLRFFGYDGAGKPKFVLVQNIGNFEKLRLYAPQHGVPVAGSRVRLRNATTGDYLNIEGGDWGYMITAPGAQHAGLYFRLDSAGPGVFRLRHELTNQCVLNIMPYGERVRHFSCWDDQAMKFEMLPVSGNAYQFKQVTNGTCFYQSYSTIHSWGCWGESPESSYKVDILDY